MQQRLRESYLEMSNDNDATCSPVGVAWRTFRTQYPSVELYNPDQSHPSVNGTYLAACVFYTSLYQKSTVGASYVLAGVQATDAPNIQSIASATVLDSLENWQQYGHLPYADFSFSVNQNQVTFTNNSLRAATYDWDFGDGSPINNTVNPTHTYTAVGNYTVSLQAKSNCNKFARKNKQISINTIPNTLDDLDNSTQNTIFYSEGKLFLQGSFTEVMVINLHGDRVLLDLNKTKRPYVGCDYLPMGVYFYRAIDKEQRIVMGKFVKE
jgi:PKD repeat protein